MVQANATALGRQAWTIDERTLPPIERAYHYVLRGILSGELGPGMHVPSEAVAMALGISRMPVRDALRRLEGDGVVVIFANRGAIIAEYTAEEVVQLIEIRAVLEGLGARLALANIGQREMDELLYRKTRMERSADDLARWIACHDDFHNYLTSLSKRPMLLRQTERIRLMLRPYFRRHHAQRHELEIPGHEHTKITDAIQSGNAELVEQVVKSHALANLERIAKLA
ncbi:MAG TPA: GntR family transcriptional regulator [Pseudolabrys sp.]|nr:GntR family transcriptional regulator [Pseudolabrys sp.]